MNEWMDRLRMCPVGNWRRLEAGGRGRRRLLEEEGRGGGGDGRSCHRGRIKKPPSVLGSKRAGERIIRIPDWRIQFVTCPPVPIKAGLFISVP